MSIDLNWETLTTGPDGDALAHSIRDFIHTKFQSVPLPRFIKSVTVHDFAFGATPPELELKDITDPLPDFYEENPAADDDEDSDDEDDYVVERDGDGDGEYGEYERGGGRGGNGRFGGLAVPGGRFAANGSGGGGVHGLRGAASATTDLRRRGNGGAPPSSNSKGARERPGAPPHLRTGAGGARLSAIPPHITTTFPGAHMRGISSIPQDMGSPFLGTSTPGIPGGTSNLHYFHSHLAGGLSGTQTPLAAVAGAQLGNNNPNNNNNNNNQYNYHQSRSPEAGESSPMSISTAGFSEHLYHGAAAGAGIDHRAPSHSRNPSQGSISVEGFNQSATSSSLSGLTPIHLSDPALREKSSVSTFAATSSGGTSRPPTRDKNILGGSAIVEDDDVNDDQNISDEDDDDDDNEEHPRFREPRIEDIQAVFRIRYSGDVKLLLTADILLDYPMPSFVGIPLRLSITGLSFDGVGVVAYIRKRVHFCFLSPEDALAAVGADEEEGVQQQDGSGSGASGGNGPAARNTKMGGLLQEIRVESEIGQREGGKQSLKNVGKVERFVLEQVRRIFEEEFVYPSFWTFLV